MSRHEHDLLDIASSLVMACVCGLCGLPWGLTFWQGASLYGFGHVICWFIKQARAKPCRSE